MNSTIQYCPLCENWQIDFNIPDLLTYVHHLPSGDAPPAVAMSVVQEVVYEHMVECMEQMGTLDVRDFYLARCHHCLLDIPFGNRAERDDWVLDHRKACRHGIDTWMTRTRA